MGKCQVGPLCLVPAVTYSILEFDVTFNVIASPVKDIRQRNEQINNDSIFLIRISHKKRDTKQYE